MKQPMNKQEKNKQNSDTDNSMVVTRGKGWGAVKGQGVKYVVTEGDLTVGGGHTLQYTDHVS